MYHLRAIHTPMRGTTRSFCKNYVWLQHSLQSHHLTCSISYTPFTLGEDGSSPHNKELEDFLASLSSKTRNVSKSISNKDNNILDIEKDDKLGDEEFGIVGSGGAFGELDEDYVRAVRELSDNVVATKKQGNISKSNQGVGVDQGMSKQRGLLNEKLSSIGRLSKTQWVELFKNQIALRIYGCEDSIQTIAQEYKIDPDMLSDVLKYTCLPTLSSEIEEKPKEKKRTIGGVPRDPNTFESQVANSDIAYWISPIQLSPEEKINVNISNQDHNVKSDDTKTDPTK